MSAKFPDDHVEMRENEEWQPPEIIEKGKVEARLFSDEPDPWGDF